MSDVATATPTASVTPNAGKAPAAAQSDAGGGLSRPKDSRPRNAEGVTGSYVPGGEAETAEGGDEAQAKAEAKAEAKRKFKLKDEDGEYEVDEDELQKGYQRARAANKKFEQAANVRKQVEGLVQALREQPAAILEKVLGDKSKVRETMEAYLRGIYEEEMLPEPDRKLKEVERREQALAEKERQEAEAKETQAFEQAKAQAFERNAKLVTEILQAGDLPKTPFTVKRVAEYLVKAKQNGWKVTREDIAEMVKEDYQTEGKPKFDDMEGDKILDLIGETNVKKVQEALLRRAQPKVAAAQAGDPRQHAREPRNQAPKKMTIQEWRERNQKLYGL